MRIAFLQPSIYLALAAPDRRVAPSVYRTRGIVKSKSVSAIRFVNKTTCPRMLLHAPHHLVDRIEHGHVSPLRIRPLRQSLRGCLRDHRASHRHRRAEPLHQLHACQLALRRELRIAPTHVWLAARPMHHPLPHVPAHVQHQVADCVLMRRAALPHLPVGLASRRTRQAAPSSAPASGTSAPGTIPQSLRPAHPPQPPPLTLTTPPSTLNEAAVDAPTRDFRPHLPSPVPPRSMVGLTTLTRPIGVRIPGGQPSEIKHLESIA
jgi:hypothetical protein